MPSVKPSTMSTTMLFSTYGIIFPQGKILKIIGPMKSYPVTYSSGMLPPTITCPMCCYGCVTSLTCDIWYCNPNSTTGCTAANGDYFNNNYIPACNENN